MTFSSEIIPEYQRHNFWDEMEMGEPFGNETVESQHGMEADISLLSLSFLTYKLMKLYPPATVSQVW